MEHILNNICLVNLGISLWQGKKTLKPEDLATNGIDVSKLPPGSLASLGSKKTVANDAIKTFVALKRKAIAECVRYGVKFGDGGYAIPDTHIMAVSKILKEVKDQFIITKDEFMIEYPRLTEEWILQNPPEWQSIIRNSLDAPSTVANALSFNFAIYTINPTGPEIENGLEEEVGGLHAQLCKEIRGMAKIAFDTSYVGKTEVGQRALRPLKAISAKLKAMSFLDPDITPLTDMIDAQLINAGTASVIDGQKLQILTGLLANHLMSYGKATVYEEATDLLEEPLEEFAEIEQEPVVPACTVSKLDYDF